MTANNPTPESPHPEPQNPTRRRGRPRKKIDPELVETLARAALTLQEIGSVVRCSADTLQRRFGTRLADWRANGTASVKRELFLLATGPGSKQKLGACCAFLKFYGGARESIALSGPDGGPVKFEGMTDAELDTYIQRQLVAAGYTTQVDGASGACGSTDREDPTTSEE